MNANTFIPNLGSEKSKGSLKPFAMLYHREDIKQLTSEISPFPFENAEVTPWSYNITTHASVSKKETWSGSEEVAPCG